MAFFVIRETSLKNIRNHVQNQLFNKSSTPDVDLLSKSDPSKSHANSRTNTTSNLQQNIQPRITNHEGLNITKQTVQELGPIKAFNKRKSITWTPCS